MNGTPENLDIISQGSLMLSKIPKTQLIQNGNFTTPDDLSTYASVDNWTSSYSGDVLSHDELRVVTGGAWDDVYCWRNKFMEWDAGNGFNASVWLNQTFNLTSIPLSINISALHNFQNNSYSLNPGNQAKVLITNLSPSQVYLIFDSGVTNQSYSGYQSISSNDTNIFLGPGLYNLTLFTFTNSTGRNSDTCIPNGILNFWDNASIEYDAYVPEGTFTSQVFNAGSYAMWKNISWDESLPPGTDVRFYVRTGNSSVPTDSIWSPWTAALSQPTGSSIDRPWGKYLQYRIEFTTLYTNVTPSVDNIKVTYEKYRLGGTIDTRDFMPASLVKWGYFSYSEELKGQTAKFYYSHDSGATWVEVPLDGDLRAVPPTTPGLRFRAVINTTDTVVSPVLRSMQINYVSLTPSFTVEPVWNSSGVSPMGTVRLMVYFNNTAQSRSSIAWLNVYLDDRLEYLDNNTQTLGIFSGFIPDSNSGIQKYVFSDIPQGSNLLWIDARVQAGTLDGDVLQTTVTLDYLGPLGNRVEAILEKAPIRVNGPIVEANLVAWNMTADVGDTVDYGLYINNTGRGAAEKVWVNGTLDDRLEGNNISLELRGVAGNSSTLLPFNATLRENVVQGSLINMRLNIDYSDSSGFTRHLETNSAAVNALLRSVFSINLVSQTSSVNSSEMLVMTIHFNNSGYGSAENIRFVFSIPVGLEFVSSSEECIVSGDACIWELYDVGPGPHSFTLTLRAQKMGASLLTAEDMFVSMMVTDPVDGARLAVQSNRVNVDIFRVYTIWEKIYWPWSGLATGILLFSGLYAAWYFFRPEPPSIDDAFVIYRDGRLLTHRKSTSGKKSDLDGDLVGAMLTAVQEFISDSLSNDKSDKVKKLEFGDRELFLERGENINLVLIYSGSMNKKLEIYVRELTEKIEREHPFLPSWDGRMTQLGDIPGQIDEMIMRWQYQKRNGAN